MPVSLSSFAPSPAGLFQDFLTGGSASQFLADTCDDLQVMKHLYLDIAVAIYLLLGLLCYSGISGAGAEFESAKKPSFFRRLLVILLWPLALIGAIES